MVNADRTGIGGRIKAARARRGLSQAELGDAVGLDKTAISKIEHDVRSVSSTELADISDALGVSMRDLVRSRRPSPVLQFVHRLGTAGDGEAAVRARRALIDIIELEVLLDELGVPQPTLTDLPDLARPTADATASGRQLARDLRAHLGLGLHPIDDIEGLLEDLGVRVIGRPLGDGDEALAGVCTTHPAFRAALINTDQWGTRQRFTAAHELGHLLFGDAEAAGWHDDHDADMRSGSTSTQEIRANAFAAELLLPLDAVEARVTRTGVTEAMITDTMFDYGISLPSIVYRLVEGGHISRDEADNWRSLSVNNLAWTFNRQEEHRHHGAARGRVRAPSITHQRAVRAYAMGAIGIGPLAGLLGADAEQLRTELDEAGLSPAAYDEVDVLDML